MPLKLHCFGESGHSYKAALALELSGLDWAPVPVDFFTGITRRPDWRAEVNEMGECPVLEIPETGEKLSQSGAIQMWVAEASGKFGGETAQEARQVLRWILWDNGKLSTQAGALRFLMNFLPEEKRPQETIAFFKARCQDSYKTLETHLATRDWIVGTGPTMADFTCCGYLFYPEEFGFDRSAYPAIDGWLNRVSSLPGWKHPYDLMPPAHPNNR